MKILEIILKYLYAAVLMNLQRLGGIHAFLICHLRAINIYTSEGMDKVNMDIHFFV